MKIVAPNPKFVDGAWVSKKGDMEVTLYVPPNMSTKFRELFEGYAKGLGMTGSVEFLQCDLSPRNRALQKARL